MIEISEFIIVEKIFDESECRKIIDSKSEFIKSPKEQQNNKKFLIAPDESNYTFGHINFPYWHVESADENEWFIKKLRERVTEINDKFFKFKNNGLWNMGMYEYFNHPDYNNSCSWHFDDMSRGKRLGCSTMLHKAVEGGEFEIFNGETVSMNINVGEVAFFPTWFFHRVKPVIEGKRITLVTWMKGNTINF